MVIAIIPPWSIMVFSEIHSQLFGLAIVHWFAQTADPIAKPYPVPCRKFGVIKY